MFDLIIVGGGPGGLSAGLYGARSNLKVAIIEAAAPGGKMVTTSSIENYPGFKAIDGPDLSMMMFEQVTELGVEYISDKVIGIAKENDIFTVTGEQETYEAKSVIIATGTVNRKLGVLGEEKFHSKGVSWCALCDGPFYRGKEVAVIGGGDSAFKEGLYLSQIVDKVYIIHRREGLRADPILQDRVKNKDNIELILNTEVKEFKGDDVLSAVHLCNNVTNECWDLPVSGCFEYLGQEPSTEFLKELGILNDSGFIKVNENMETSVRGLFAVGDVLEKEVRQIATATNDGVIAALSASEYIRNT